MISHAEDIILRDECGNDAEFVEWVLLMLSVASPNSRYYVRVSKSGSPDALVLSMSEFVPAGHNRHVPAKDWLNISWQMALMGVFS